MGKEFEEYKKALDPQVTLDIVCYSGKGTEVYVNLLNPSEIADKEYNIILAYYDKSGNVIKTHIKPFKTTTAYKESFTGVKLYGGFSNQVSFKLK